MELSPRSWPAIGALDGKSFVIIRGEGGFGHDYPDDFVIINGETR